MEFLSTFDCIVQQLWIRTIELIHFLMNQEIHRTKKQKEKVGRSLPKIQEGLSLTKLLKNKGCGSKQVVQDLNEAEESRIKRRKEPHLVTIEPIKEESRYPDNRSLS